MAWLFHPDDYAALADTFMVTTFPRAGLGEIEVRRDATIERGHMADTAHPEIGAPTFAEFGERYAKAMEAERAKLDEAVSLFEKLTSGKIDQVPVSLLFGDGRSVR